MIQNIAQKKLYFIILLILLFFKNNVFDFNYYKNQYNNFKDNNIIEKNKNIKVAYYLTSIKFGGIARTITLLINYLSKINIFEHYLIIKSKKLKGEYIIPKKTKRISLFEKNITLFDVLEQEKIDILIYNFFNNDEIEKLNALNSTQVIYYNHSSFLLWIYKYIFNYQKSIYYAYKKSKYVLSLIPLENFYLFEKWGIKSILINNLATVLFKNYENIDNDEYQSMKIDEFIILNKRYYYELFIWKSITYNIDLIVPSNLDTKNIIMVGRAYDPIKRYDLGIKAMKYIVNEIPDSKMYIISNIYQKYIELIKNLNLEKNVFFSGFTKNPEIFYKNASLHIMPSLSETYPMALSEAKIFGIPTILCGLDYLALAKGGTVIIYDDNPHTIAIEAIKILKNYEYRKMLGKQARENMKKHKNQLIIKKWVKILLSVYKRDNKIYTITESEQDEKISENEAKKILNNQLKLLKKRIPFFKNISYNKFKYIFK